MSTFAKAFGGTLGVIVAIGFVIMCCCGSLTVMSVIGSTITITPIP